MKPQVIFLIVCLLISAMAGISYASYQVGVKDTVAMYSEEVAKITEKALREQDELQTKLNEITHEYFESTLDEQARITELQRQLRDKPNTIKCSKVAGSNDTVAIIPGDTIRLLLEATDYKALQKTTNKSCPISETGTVTANLFTEYTICIAGKYNGIAKQLIGVIDSVKKYEEAQDK